MSEPVGFELLTLDYCLEHTPTSRLAELQKRPIYRHEMSGPKRRCHVCGATL